MKRLRTAVVGCGQIADAHLGELRRIDGVDLVATCDLHAELAEQAAARFDVPVAVDSLTRMLAETRPDVVHVTTPPQTHRQVVLESLAAGAHVYVEKPFAIDCAEAAVMVEAAAIHNRKVCVGHDQLFDAVWLECRHRQQAGDFGDIVHIDSVLGYDLTGPFGAQLAEDADHWVHRLPGGLFQNTISHAIYRITDFMRDEHPLVRAHWFAAGPATFPTDLRVMLQGEQMTANVLFSSRARPVQRVARLYGTRAVAEVNLDAQTIRVERPSAARGPFVKLGLAWAQLSESSRGLRANVRRFVQSDLHYFGGMRRLFQEFYESVRADRPSPIPTSEILRVTAIMDDIFAACADAGATRPLPGINPLRQLVGARAV